MGERVTAKPVAAMPAAAKPAHKRVRTFSVKDTPSAPKSGSDLCQAVVARGSLLFVRGQAAEDLDSRATLPNADATAQTRKAMANIKTLLEESGSEMGHVCRIVTYLTDAKYRDSVYAEMGAWLKDVFPCATTVVVTALARPEWIVEIEVTAVIPDKP